MTDLVLTDNRDGVLVVTLNRPEKKNALNTQMWIEIGETFRSAAPDDDVVSVLLCGAGDHFCSGVDLSSFGEVAEGEEHPFESAARAVVEFDKPIVAAAKGVAIGGGATVPAAPAWWPWPGADPACIRGSHPPASSGRYHQINSCPGPASGVQWILGPVGVPPSVASEAPGC